ncbi:MULTISPECIES: hypothetical protein [unclassified Streptomyces]|uniref:hypothetical protein n=1 Tax=unclassified Streptomyces TaxID=2593676 RepID=UPI002E13D27E|nr:hypothetical protein OG279_38805 [Streptomyces sp. NBC_01201]
MNVSMVMTLLTALTSLSALWFAFMARRTYAEAFRSMRATSTENLRLPPDSHVVVYKEDGSVEAVLDADGKPLKIKWTATEASAVPKGPRPPILNITEPLAKWLDKRRMAKGGGRSAAPDPALRVAERNLALAVIFLPAGQRDRYREEWAAEIYALDRQEAAAFAFRVLLRAPRAGLALLLSRVFGRSKA